MKFFACLAVLALLAFPTPLFAAAREITIQFTLPTFGNRGDCAQPVLVGYDTTGVTQIMGHWWWWPVGSNPASAPGDSAMGPIGSLIRRNYAVAPGVYNVRAHASNQGKWLCDTTVTVVVRDTVIVAIPQPPTKVAWIPSADDTVIGGPVVNVKLPVSAAQITVSATSNGTPGAVLDATYLTRWSADGDGRWIRFDLGSTKRVAFVKVMFYRGNERSSRFDIATAKDDGIFTTVSQIGSTALNNNLQTFDFPDVPQARYVRLLGHGTTLDMFISLSEVELWGGS